LQSAQMLMLGLYPPEIGASRRAAPAPWDAFTAVPIHAVALKNDNVMRPWTGKTNCRRYLKFVKALPSTRLYGEQGRKYVHFLRRIASITGMNDGEKPAKILYEINEIYEPLSSIVQHKMPLPDGISEDDLTLMRALGDWNYHHQFLGRKVGRLTGGPFVEEVARNFRRVIERQVGARLLYVYSGHQRTILGVEAALGIETARTEGPLFLGRVPPLGSRYAFELHEVTGGAYAVRLVFVSGEGEQVIRIPGCDGLMCPFERFAAIVERVAPENWRGECGF
ncbi:MAG: histidine phosphatase family protein, partial [Alphaproteobacteria bacterium]